MGFANFMVNGSYAHLADVSYSKQDKQVNALLRVYKDDTQLEELSEINYQFDGFATLPAAKTKGDTAPPASPAEGDVYIVGSAATGLWAGHDQEVAAWVDGAWVFINGEDETYRNDADGKAYKGTGSSWVEVSPFDSVAWAQFFEVADLSVAGNNLLKATYDYLKTRPEFAGVTDV